MKYKLISAAKNGRLDVVNRFLECEKSNVNLQNSSGWTVLMHASCHGHLDVVNRLLE